MESSKESNALSAVRRTRLQVRASLHVRGALRKLVTRQERHRMTRVLGFVLVSCAASGSCVSAPRGHERTSAMSASSPCEQVAKALERDRVPDTSKPLFVETVDVGGRSWRYQHVDLDRDGKADDVVQSCGSPSDGTCTLFVTLSKGGHYEFSEATFKVIRFHSRHYLVVGDSFPPDHAGSRRLYLLTEHAAQPVCNAF